jgi:hypothetical protein
MSDGISVGRRFVGIDLHLHRSVVAGLDEAGDPLGWVRIDNDPKALVAEVRKAGGRGCAVAIEATYGWYWAVDALLAARFEVHLAHPYGLKALRKRKRVKTDPRDAYELATLLRLGSLPESYIAPPELRELRELVRHRRALVKVATATLTLRHTAASLDRAGGTCATGSGPAPWDGPSDAPEIPVWVEREQEPMHFLVDDEVTTLRQEPARRLHRPRPIVGVGRVPVDIRVLNDQVGTRCHQVGVCAQLGIDMPCPVVRVEDHHDRFTRRNQVLHFRYDLRVRRGAGDIGDPRVRWGGARGDVDGHDLTSPLDVKQPPHVGGTAAEGGSSLDDQTRLDGVNDLLVEPQVVRGLPGFRAVPRVLAPSSSVFVEQAVELVKDLAYCRRAQTRTPVLGSGNEPQSVGDRLLRSPRQTAVRRLALHERRERLQYRSLRSRLETAVACLPVLNNGDERGDGRLRSSAGASPQCGPYRSREGSEAHSL